MMDEAARCNKKNQPPDVRDWNRQMYTKRILKSRVLCVHAKNMTRFGRRDAHEVPLGTGALEIMARLEEWAAQDFQGDIAVEYAFNPGNNFSESVKCIQLLKRFWCVPKDRSGIIGNAGG